MEEKKPSLKTKMVLLPLYLMPRFLKIGFAKFLVFFWYYILKIRVELTRKQIKDVFPEFDDKKVNSIVKESFFNLVMVLLEYSYIPFSKSKIKKYTKIKNFHNYENALKENKSIFFLTGHMGNGEIALARMSVEKVQLHLIGKRVGNAFLDKVLFETRETWGLKHIPPRDSMKEILRLIKDNKHIVFVNDQFIRPPRGVKTTFLGLDAYTNSAPARLALKSDAVVIPVNMYREKAKMIIDFGEELRLNENFDTEEEKIVALTQKYNDWFKEVIFARPDQWMWVHKRWKKVSQ